MNEPDYLGAIERMKKDHVNELVIELVRVQWVYGLRISDLLKIHPANITKNLTCVIEQSKNSRSLSISLAINPEFWTKYRTGAQRLAGELNRWFFYRLFERYGLVIYNGEGHNNSVTHAGRKSLAREIYEQTGDAKNVTTALGHKSERTAWYYLKTRRPRTHVEGGVLSNELSKGDVLQYRKRYGNTYIFVARRRK